MTAPEPQSPPAGTGALARYHRALPRLAALLRAADLPVSPDRWQNLYDLLLALNAQGRLPEQAAALEHLLAPLLCRSAREQQQFVDLFARWLRDLEPELRGEKEEGAAPVPPPGPTPPEAPPQPRLRWWLLGLAPVLVVVAGGVYWVNLQTQPPPPPPPPVAVDTPPLPLVVEPPPPEATQALELQPVPPRTPSETPTLDPAHRALRDTLGDLLLLLPGFFALAWLLLRWLTFKTVLKRRTGDPDDPLTAIGLDARADDLLNAPALREALKRLHTPVAIPTRRLDAAATIARTARHGGLFAPVRRNRRTVPELVVLLEQRRAGDQMAGLAGQLVDRLQAAGLTVHRYDYRGSPAQLVGPDGRWRSLGEVAARHEGARLLLVGEPAALVDSFSGEPLSWTRALAPCPQCALLFTRRPPEHWKSALTASGFLVAELDSAGVQTLALVFSGIRTTPETVLPGLTVALPHLLQDAARWTRPSAPQRAEQEALIKVLGAFLGEDGARLLAAMAVYPQLHWGLTRVLDLSLFPAADATARERRLLKVARLPWGRAGWLPDWLRAALLKRLDSGAERGIRGLYRALLHRETATVGGRIALPVALPHAVGFRAGLWDWLRHKSWRLDRWFAGLRDLGADHAALNDAIFADVLFGWRLRVLDFVVPRRLLRRRLGGALGQALAPRLALALVLALGGTWLADRAWHQWGRAEIRPHLHAMQNAAHGAYRVTIWQREETAALARALKEKLLAGGFSAAIARATLVPPAKSAEPLPPVNKIQWRDPADARMARHIKQRLAYLAWGREPEVTDELGPLAALPDLARPPGPKELRVLLLTPGNTGSGFADSLTQELTPAQIAELVAPPESAQPEAPETKQAPTKEAVEKGVTDETQPSAPATPSGAEAGTVRQFQARIEQLDKRSVELQSEMEAEETGTDGRAAGKGPRWRSLNAELQGVVAESNALAAQLRGLLGQTFRDPLMEGGEGPEMVRLPGGSFLMGSPDDEPERDTDEGPQHRVSVQPFAIGRTEVSFADYDRFADATGREKPDDEGWGRGDRPVINVRWEDATAYAQWLSEQTGEDYRLPTEAEREYAARAGTQTPFWTGDCIHTVQANYNGNYDYNGCGAKTGVYRARTVPIGSLPANALSLHEVAGNVWEWAQDCWHESYEGAPIDGSAWLESGGGDCARRVVRGGGWGGRPRGLRSAIRDWFTAGVAGDDVGIRLARTL